MHHYFMCHYKRKTESATKQTVTQFFLTISTADSSGHRDVQMCILESVKCNTSHHSHTVTNYDSWRVPKPPGLFLQLETCWTFIVCRTPLWCKILWFHISGFLPELEYSQALRPSELWRTGALGGICCLDSLKELRAFLASPLSPNKEVLVRR